MPLHSEGDESGWGGSVACGFVGEGWDQCHRAGDIMLDHAGGSAEKGSGSGLKSEFCSISTEEYHTGAKREERLLAA